MPLPFLAPLLPAAGTAAVATGSALLRALPLLLSIVPFLKTAPKQALKKSHLLKKAIGESTKNAPLRGRRLMERQTGSLVTLPKGIGRRAGEQIPIERALRLQQRLWKQGRFAPTAKRVAGAGLGGMMISDVATGNMWDQGYNQPPSPPPTSISKEEQFLMSLLNENPEVFKQISMMGMGPPQGNMGMGPPQRLPGMGSLRG